MTRAISPTHYTGGEGPGLDVHDAPWAATCAQLIEIDGERVHSRRATRLQFAGRQSNDSMFGRSRGDR